MDKQSVFGREGVFVSFIGDLRSVDETNSSGGGGEEEEEPSDHNERNTFTFFSPFQYLSIF